MHLPRCAWRCMQAYPFTGQKDVHLVRIPWTAQPLASASQSAPLRSSTALGSASGSAGFQIGTISSELEQLGQRSSGFWRESLNSVPLAAGEAYDDWWYSLSPCHKDVAAPQWSGWRLRLRYLTCDQLPSRSFRDRMEALLRYKERWGDMNVPKRFWEDWALGIWVADVRAAAARQWLNPTQKRLLGDIHFPIKASGAASVWNHNFHELRRFQAEFGKEAPTFKWRDPNADFGNDLAKWYHQLPELFAKSILLPDQVQKLLSIGWRPPGAEMSNVLMQYHTEWHARAGSGSDSYFQAMYAELCSFRDTYGTAIVPRQLHDNVCLGEWVHLLRRQKKKQLLSRWHIECLRRVQFVWKVPQQTALWHYHLHEARRYKETHGHARMPEDYHDKNEPGWMEAARWLTRNARLFAKGKLSDNRYQLIQRILGIKFMTKIGGKSLQKDGSVSAPDVKHMGPCSRHHQGTM